MMKHPIVRFAVPAAFLGLVVSTLSAAAPRISLEDFARSPLYDDMQLSFDGQCLAFLTEYEGQRVLCFQEGKIDSSGKWIGQGIVRIDPGKGKFHSGWKDVNSFSWISPTRVLFSTTVHEQYSYGAAACNRDGHYMMTVGGFEREQVEHPLILGRDISDLDKRSGDVLMEELSYNHSSGVLTPYPDVDKVDTIHGTAERILENPGHVTSWYADYAGAVRAGIALDPETLAVSFVYRQNVQDPWKTTHVLGDTEKTFVPLAFTHNANELLVSHLDAGQRWVLATYDMEKGALGPTLASDDQYDVDNPHWNPHFDHTPLFKYYTDVKTHAPEGVTYVAEGPRVKWFTEEAAQRQAMIDQALPKHFNLIRNRSEDGQRLLILSFSDRDAGTYYLYDTKASSLSMVGGRMPWLKPADMAAMFPIKLKARDGLQLHGYVTLPPDSPRQHLPLVVLVHGGPQARDSWQFDPLVQLLANRGYAVLQINFRGSLGYGDAFYEKGRHEIGRAMQTDIDDATQWAIKSGLADPKRVAIVGGSYGGYATMYGLETRPDLYSCGISLAGVTDWGRLIASNARDEETRFAYNYWVKQLGDPHGDEQHLAEVSPVTHAADLRAPLLIIQGEDDSVVPVSQAHEMVDALKKAGHAPETLYISGLPHSFGNERQRLQIYKHITEFLEKNLHG